MGRATRQSERFAFQSIRRLTRPDRENLVDGFDEHCVAVLIEHAHRLSIGPVNARADAHDEATLQNMVEHGNVRCHDMAHEYAIGFRWPP
ncbi:MAG: hypothetical protein QOF91_770 [Alphaproteobacteria bacterium]|nr:hypothetical protein [Alphaproteobacteria bacterium]